MQSSLWTVLIHTNFCYHSLVKGLISPKHDINFNYHSISAMCNFISINLVATSSVHKYVNDWHMLWSVTNHNNSIKVSQYLVTMLFSSYTNSKVFIHNQLLLVNQWSTFMYFTRMDNQEIIAQQRWNCSKQIKVITLKGKFKLNI